MMYCLFGTHFARYVCSTNRKMLLSYFVFFVKTLQLSPVNSEKFKQTFELMQ